MNLPKGVFDPLKYPNPSLQWHYKILQALALDEDLPNTPEDKTLPKYKQIDKRVANETFEWGKALDAAYKQFSSTNPDAVHTGGKRSTNGAPTASGDGAASKKVKTEHSDAIGEEEMRKYWTKGQLSSLTVAQLRDFCGAKRIPAAGKKADIIDRIEGFFENK